MCGVEMESDKCFFFRKVEETDKIMDQESMRLRKTADDYFCTFKCNHLLQLTTGLDEILSGHLETYIKIFLFCYV